MFIAFFRVSAALCCTLALFAQAPGPTPPAAAAGLGAISGLVVDRVSNTPLRRAVVTLSTLEAQPQDAVAWTDANGRFGFGLLPVGGYELHVTKNGYQPAAYGSEDPRRPSAAIRLAAGEVRNDVVVRMTSATSVSGLVLDESGDPVAGVRILAKRQAWQRQKLQLLPGPSTVSDATGHYRISLAPGRYAFLAAAQNQSVLRINPEVSAGSPQPRYVYGQQYYPGTDRADSASLITVEPGREYPQIDFHLAPQPITTVQGRIVLPAGVSAVDQVTIYMARDDLGNFGAGASKPDYIFRFDQFPPGSYKLMALAEEQGKRYRGVQETEVGPEGVRDLVIALEPGIDLSGSVSIEGPDAAKFSASSVTLLRGDEVLRFGSPQLRANVAKDGRFTITGVLPGVWDINVSPVPPGGYIKSMYLGDEDVLTEEMVIRASTAAPLKIVLGTQAASLSGEVTGGDPPARAVVLAAPDGKFRHVLSFYRSAATDGEGHFQIKGLTPGNYKLFAFDEFDPQSIQDPEFLRPFEQAGVPVTLREGTNPPQKLSLIPAANGARSGARP
jgi:Carboxypeptidase regulatory-like domain